MNFKAVALWTILSTLWFTSAQAQVVPLPKLNVDIRETSVSGLSSGGYMAVQFHVANSAIVKGAGVVAGGPYFCAQDDQGTATAICSCTGFGTCQPGRAAQMVPDLVRITGQNAQQGTVDATSHLSTTRVWLFSGSADTVVPQTVMDALETYYKNYVSTENILFKKDIAAEHAMPTDSFGSACNFRGDPFINDCDFDAAGDLLQWIYGALNAKNSGVLSGRFIEFDQREFLANPTAHGLSPTGWVYVPASCQQNSSCKVHIVFHGCRQYPGSPYAAGPQGKFGDTYVRNAGYNPWADTNNMVILYPQANAMTINTRLPRSNPNGCWDWWGYDDEAYAKKSGRQMAAVRAMVDRLSGATSPPDPQPGFCGSTTNTSHAGAGRAYALFFWWYFARGSNDFLGFGATQTTLRETAPGSFNAVAACP